jgi:hypothetical protein
LERRCSEEDLKRGRCQTFEALYITNSGAPGMVARYTAIQADKPLFGRPKFDAPSSLWLFW